MEFRILTVEEFEKLIDQFCDLYKQCYSGQINTEIVRWRYLENPCKDLLFSAAIDNGKLVANSAASPCRLMNDGKVHKAALFVNLMTHPDYRRKNLYLTLENALYSQMKEKGYKCSIAFPNHISNPITVKRLGRTTIYEIPTMELKLTVFKKELVSADNVKEDDAFLLHYPGFINGSKKIYIMKNVEYLKWRYYKNPEHKYKNFVLADMNQNVSSYLICKEYEDKINIVDMSASCMEDLNILVSKAINYAFTLNKNYITVWLPIGTQEHLIFEELGFRNNYPVTYFSVKSHDYSENEEQLFDYRNWFVHQGDDNVY